MTTIQEAQMAYEEIIGVMEKYIGMININTEAIKDQRDRFLFGLQLQEYGFNIDPHEISNVEWHRNGEYCIIGVFGEKNNRTISWPDDGKQPDNELLCRFSFPTGAYIFDRDYPKELFQAFWQELLQYKPDYLDTVNKSLYWKASRAGKIYNNFPNILQKYGEKNVIDAKERKIKTLQKELEKLTKI